MLELGNEKKRKKLSQLQYIAMKIPLYLVQ